MGTASPLPAINSTVRLSHADWPEEARTRVEEAADEVVVARPSHAGATPASAMPGDGLELRWRSPDGLRDLAVELVADIDDPVPMWRLRPTGTVRLRQRRETFRLGIAMSVRLAGEAGARAPARVRDLSEGGLACSAPADLPLDTGTWVEVELTLDGSALRLPAEVVRACPAGEVGLRFGHVAESDAERIRRFLFSEQLARKPAAAPDARA